MTSGTLETIVSQVQTALSTGEVFGIIGQALTIALPLVIAWFGFRFVYGKAKSAFRKGK